MKNIFFILLSGFVFLSSCHNKTDVKPGTIDTLKLTPPAALDTMQLQVRPSDSLLRTKRH